MTVHPMPNELDPKTKPSQSMIYEIKVEGHLGQQWTEWFGDATITLEDSGNTRLACPVVDQAALYGLLKKVRDLGMPLVSVFRIKPGTTDVPDTNEEQIK